MSNQSRRVPDYLAALVDDAAIFPPGNAPLDEAVAAHRKHRLSDWAALVGPFVVSDVRLPELLDLLDGGIDKRETEEPLPVTVVVTGGAGAIEPAVRWATRSESLEVCSIETPLRLEDDLARNAARVAAAVTAARDELGDVPAYVEPPRVVGEPTAGWLAALDEIAAADLRLKLRTGGLTADAFPSAAELGASIDAALDRELVFKCTAGMHHAVAHTDEETRFAHHGFLNVLLATRAALSGAADPEWSCLDIHDPGLVVDELLAYSLADLTVARRWFASFGCCSVTEPLEDLVALGLVSL